MRPDQLKAVHVHVDLGRLGKALGDDVGKRVGGISSLDQGAVDVVKDNILPDVVGDLDLNRGTHGAPETFLGVGLQLEDDGGLLGCDAPELDAIAEVAHVPAAHEVVKGNGSTADSASGDVDILDPELGGDSGVGGLLGAAPAPVALADDKTGREELKVGGLGLASAASRRRFRQRFDWLRIEPGCLGKPLLLSHCRCSFTHLVLFL